MNRTEGPNSVELENIQTLGRNTAPPQMWTTDVSDEAASVRARETKAIFFDGAQYEGNPTRIYGWLGMPHRPSSLNRKTSPITKK